MKSFGEELLRLKTGGSLAVIAPTSPMDSRPNYRALKNWMTSGNHPTVAEKINHTEEAKEIFAILGDPLLPLLVPESAVVECGGKTLPVR